jgi:hypothetical protein
MQKRIFFGCLFLLIVLFSEHVSAQVKDPLDSLLRADTSALIKKILANPDKYRVQIIYSQIDYSTKNPTIKDYSFRLRPEEYFYPASLVKLPLSALALERLNNMKIKGVDRNTPLYTNPKYSGYYNDSLPPPSIGENIMQMMVVSDNYAFNRVYDFLGQEYSHLRLFQKGYTSTRIIQRLSSATDEENRVSGPFKFVDTSGNVLYEEETLTTTRKFLNPAKNVFVGKAYLDGRRKIYHAKDFSSNNFLPLISAHQMLISLMTPGFIQPRSRFELSQDDYNFLKKVMGMYPRETGVEAWKNDSIYYDCFRKFLYYGNYTGPANPNLRIYNKVGMAYGFMSDVAYFVDTTNKVEFFLSAAIYVNEDEILNDGKYDYYSIGYPFMEKLGKMIYNFELTRDGCSRGDE